MRPFVPPPIWDALFMLGMVGVHRAVPLATYGFPGQTTLALLVAATGAGVALLGAVRFRRHQTSINPLTPTKATYLVTGGVFALTRNPMYVGMLLLLVALGVYLGSLSPWIFPPLFVLWLTLVQIKPEEAAMARLFGEAWVEYRAKTPRWLIW